MEKKDITRKYTNGEITVLWKHTLCAHSGNCVRSLPGVFIPKEKPWIKIHSASSPEIRAAVAACPSGALTVIENPEK